MKRFFFCFCLFCLIFGYLILSYFHIIPKKSYTNAYFGISDYVSGVDYDGDGIDDQLDILLGARNYVQTKPKYKSKYYSGGYPNDSYGVCTDVVAFAFLASGYNLKEMVSLDIREHPEDYGEDVGDSNIDFRRVRNLNVFFSHHAKILTNDISAISEWQGGDIVVFPKHIAIVSDKRNKKGITYIIHHGGQPVYEEDSLGRYEIIGHYRFP